MATGKNVSTLEEYVCRIRRDRADWGADAVAWFRGEPTVDIPLLPKLYRPKPGGGCHDENQLLQLFRMKAPTYAPGQTPERGHTDQWLFLAQHVGLPTRLLDWTEGALIALYFALDESKPVVWMLNPHELNQLSVRGKPKTQIEGSKYFPLTWFDPKGTLRNIGVENIKAAWSQGNRGLELPVAVIPTYLHPRMSAQRSVFTVHGANKQPLCDLVPEGILKRYEIDPGAVDQLRSDLYTMGIHHSTVLPDLDGLARELCALC